MELLNLQRCLSNYFIVNVTMLIVFLTYAIVTLTNQCIMSQSYAKTTKGFDISTSICGFYCTGVKTTVCHFVKITKVFLQCIGSSDCRLELAMLSTYRYTLSGLLPFSLRLQSMAIYNLPIKTLGCFSR